MTPAGLPHSEIPGSTVVCTSPRLIAAYHVLHRFPEPRHPPYALVRLTSISSSPRSATHERLPTWPFASRPCRQTPARRRRKRLVSTNSLGAPCQRTNGGSHGLLTSSPTARGRCPLAAPLQGSDAPLTPVKGAEAMGPGGSEISTTHSRPSCIQRIWWRIPGSNR